MADFHVNIRFDAENKQIILNVVDAAGVIQSDWGEIALTLGKDPGTNPSEPGTTMGEIIQLRETKGLDASGNEAYALVLRSPSYATPKTAGFDFQGGGAGGNVHCYRIKEIGGDWVKCKFFNGSEVGADVWIAKPPKLRNVSSEVIDGITYDYSYTTPIQRDVSVGGTFIETQVVVPRYQIDDLIFIAHVNYTGALFGSTALYDQDLNADGRAWAKKA